MREPIRFRLQNENFKNDCFPLAVATALEIMHKEIRNDGVYFSPNYFSHFEADMREDQGRKSNEPTNTTKALMWLKREGFIHKFSLVWKTFIKKHLKEAPLILIRDNYKGQKLVKDQWYIPPNAEKKTSTHAIVCLDYDPKQGYLIQDSKYERTYFIPEELFKKIIRQIIHLTL